MTTGSFTQATPYPGKGSGWSGTDTSAAGEPRRRSKQRLIWEVVRGSGSFGSTAMEVENMLGYGHGEVSSALSALHQKQQLLRLVQQRNGQRVYVHPSFLGGREHDAPTRNRTNCPHCGGAL